MYQILFFLGLFSKEMEKNDFLLICKRRTKILIQITRVAFQDSNHVDLTMVTYCSQPVTE